MSENTPSLLGKIAAYTEILAKDPRSTVFVSLAEAYRQLGMLDDALEIAAKGTTHLPGFTPGFTVLGRIYAQRGELDEAAEAFERSLAIEKTNLLALKGLARIRLRQGQGGAARELLGRALEIDPEDETARKELAALPSAPAGNPVVSQLAARQQAPTRPVSPSGPSARAAGIAENETEEEQATARPIQTETMGDLYRKQGLVLEAAKIYRELLRAAPHNERVRSKLIAIRQELEAVIDGPGPGDQPAAAAPEKKLEAEPAAAPGPSFAPHRIEEPVAPVAAAAAEQEAAATPEPLAEEAPSESGPPEPAAADPLKIFELWLYSIQQRRAHVR